MAQTDRTGSAPAPSLRQVYETLQEFFVGLDRPDPGVNGLQVAPDDWERPCRLLATGVTSSQRFLRQALERSADLCLVHHGLFWRGDSPVVEGMLRERLRLLLDGGVALAAWHLPLDVHPQLGNNARLGAELGLRGVAEAGEEGLLFRGELPQPLGLDELADDIGRRLDTRVLAVPGRGGGNGEAEKVRTLAWCTGAGQRYIAEAARLGVDAFLSGEISEQTTHAARELGVDYLACGHHATERYGVQALGEALRQRMAERGLAVRHLFLEDANPA